MSYIQGGLNQVQAWNGVTAGLPPNVDYHFMVETVAQEASRKQGVPQLVLSLTVQNQGEFFGRKHVARYNIDFAKGKSRERLRCLIDACGIPLDANGGFDDAMLVGRVFKADLVAAPYTVSDPVTGQTIQKEGVQLQNERPLTAMTAPAVAPQPYVAAPAVAPQPYVAATPVQPLPGGQQFYAPPQAQVAPAYPQPAPAPARGAPAGLTPVR
jgi:hypothetical protein